MQPSAVREAEDDVRAGVLRTTRLADDETPGHSQANDQRIARLQFDDRELASPPRSGDTLTRNRALKFDPRRRDDHACEPHVGCRDPFSGNRTLQAADDRFDFG